MDIFARARAQLIYVLAALSAAASLPGCAVWEVHQNWSDIQMNTDQSAEIQARTNMIRANLAAMMSKTDGSGKSVVVEPSSIDLLSAFGTLDENGLLKPADTAKAVGIVDQGFGYVDDRCNFFFGELLKVQKDTHFWSTEAAILGTAAGAIIAIAGPGIQAAGLAAAATAAAVASTENFGSDLLFDIDAGTTYDLNKKYRDAYQSAAHARANGIVNYASAYTVISNYAALCTPVAIESQVKAELRNAAPHAKDAPVDEQIAKLRALQLKNELANLANLTGLDTSFDIGQARLLYLLFVAGGEKDPVLKAGIHKKLAKASEKNDAAIFDGAAPPKVIVTKENHDQLFEGLNHLAVTDPTLPAEAQKIKEELVSGVPGAVAVPAAPVVPAAPAAAAAPAAPAATPSPPAAETGIPTSGNQTGVTNIQVGPKPQTNQ
jgi:hypothetical protein